MKEMPSSAVTPIETVRANFIRILNNSKSEDAREFIARDLFNLGLTGYSKNYTLDSIIYNSLAKSYLDKKISLFPEQLDLVRAISDNDALIVSAPTSFGKTFCVFEYIAKTLPKNVVLVVPTLALVDEYLKKIISKYKNIFSIYNKFINFSTDVIYNYDDYNIFILTHDKVMESTIYKKIDKIDFLVIDEVYKLQKDNDNDRVLVLNLAYHFLSLKAKKYVLLAPFISGVIDREKLNRCPALFKTTFSPVVNELKTVNISNENERMQVIAEHTRLLYSKKTLVYFPTVREIPKFVNSIIVNNFSPIEIKDDNVRMFINWIKNEIHEDWYLVKAMERGFLVHNGQLPNNGFRAFQLDLYNTSPDFNMLLCTSTLLEGVNMCSENIIITKPARNSTAFDAFDFYNLVGRTGRLFEHYLGYAYYIKGPEDISYYKTDAIKEIKFEATDNSEDFDFFSESGSECSTYNTFLEKLHITADEYKENIGPKYKISTVMEIYDSYLQKKESLIDELIALRDNPEKGRGILVSILYRIIDAHNPYISNLNSSIVNQLLNKNRLKLKVIVNKLHKHYPRADIDSLISSVLKLKNSFIEHKFYSMCKNIMFFMKCEGVDETLIELINKYIINNIDYLYFSDSKCKKILKDLGIYEYDVKKIVDIIGDDFDNVNDIIDVLKTKHFENLSYISNYVISLL